ncbi:MAG: NEW3 domain-containing protein, partial [Actinomycetota bacterium]
QGAPLQGWTVTAHPSAEQQASTVKVEGGGSATLTVEANPPDAIAAGKYNIKVRAEAGPKSAETTLVAEITGNAKIEVTTPNERLNTDAVAGRARKLTLLIKNDGTTALKGVTMSGSPPGEWKVTFDPEKITEIRAKGSATTEATITPSGDAVAGDYTLTVTASAEGSSDDAELRVTVKTSGFLGLVGLVVIAGAVYMLLRVFGRFGRR